jgi:hypothetical protein
VARERSITHVLVKFSSPRNSPQGVRWSDLLIAEHVASVVLNEHGITGARSELLEYDWRVFLQSERLDRLGADGRRGVASLNCIDLDRYEGQFELAPVYDMLPVLFAPHEGQLVERRFEPAGPAAAMLMAWPQARELAKFY